ncbi:MAG: hypothetical protein IJV07_01105 [Alphaproteobacteria bacterium]|nr:hypothetical protein [Alphaproteobacteria bacterium]
MFYKHRHTNKKHQKKRIDQGVSKKGRHDRRVQKELRQLIGHWDSELQKRLRERIIFDSHEYM